MMKIYSLLFLTILLTFLSLASNAQKIKSIKFESEELLTNEGLYFEGAKDVTYHFGKRITPHGDCIDVINGYVFVTWYKGGMDKMNVMLSRKPIDGGEWVTIEFPDTHIGYRGDKSIGDSHNTIAVGICPIDSTIHLIYDMHAYSKVSYPNHYFNYRVTQKGKAFVADDEFTIDIFNDKRHYLKQGVNYERSTYPGFNRFDDGRIMVNFRFGGSGHGDAQYSIYDGNLWGAPIQYNEGTQTTGDGNYSIYGGFNVLHGKLHAGYAIRYALANSDDNFKYDVNNGLYYSVAESPFGRQNWKDINGNSIGIPLQDPNMLKVGEPCEIGIGNRITSGPKWTVTKNGAIHYLSIVSGTPVHYFKNPEGTEFIHSTDCPTPNGDVFAVGENVLMVYLDGSRAAFKTTPEGENLWSTIYKYNYGSTLRHCNVRYDGERIYVYAMKVGSGQAQPITLQTFKVEFEPEKNPVIRFIKPGGDTTLTDGYTLSAEVEVMDQDVSLEHMKLFINDELIRQIDEAPYLWGKEGSAFKDELNNLSPGKYKITAEASLPSGETESASFVLTVLENQITPCDVTASRSDVNHGPELLIDKDHSNQSYWSGRGLGTSVTFDLCKEYQVSKLGIQWLMGNRWAYKFDVEVSNDMENWTQVYSGQSSGESDQVELIELEPMSGRYIRYIGNGNTSSSNNSIIEVEIYGKLTTHIKNLVSQSKQLSILPNPAVKVFQISLCASRISEVRLFNLEGELVFEQRSQTKNKTLSLQPLLSPGIYLLQVIDEDNKPYHQRLIIY